MKRLRLEPRGSARGLALESCRAVGFRTHMFSGEPDASVDPADTRPLYARVSIRIALRVLSGNLSMAYRSVVRGIDSPFARKKRSSRAGSVLPASRSAQPTAFWIRSGGDGTRPAVPVVDRRPAPVPASSRLAIS